MVVTGLLACLNGQLTFEKGLISTPSLPNGLIVLSPIQAFSDVASYGLYAVVFSFLLVTLFDTTGTVLGVSRQAGLLVDNKLPRAERALVADSAATLTVFGTSPTSAYIESASGVAAGGRTGVTAVVVALLFGIAAFLALWWVPYQGFLRLLLRRSSW